MSMGKLELEMPFTELVRREIYSNAIDLLEIKPNHLDELAKLPFHHKDPFDRLMISQALAENIVLVTRDSAFGNYPVRLLW